jgi:hypothetical protein
MQKPTTPLEEKMPRNAKKSTKFDERQLQNANEAARASAAIRRDPPAVDWPAAIVRLRRILADVYGDGTE